MSTVPRGFALLLEAATASGWGWVAFSHRGVIESGSIVEHKRVVIESTGVKTVAIFWRGGQLGARSRSLFAWWRDGTFGQGWHRDVRDPAPVQVGARALRPLLEDVVVDDELAGPTVWSAPGPRWERPDLGDDEGSPAALRWSLEIESRVQDGMDRTRAYAQRDTRGNRT